MLRYVKLDNNRVITVYPAVDDTLGIIERRFPASYINSLMVVADDEVTIAEGMYYKDGEFVTADEWQPDTPSVSPEPPLPTATVAEKLAALESENAQLQAKIKATTESNAMLEECLVEMAGVVYV